MFIKILPIFIQLVVYLLNCKSSSHSLDIDVCRIYIYMNVFVFYYSAAFPCLNGCLFIFCMKSNWSIFLLWSVHFQGYLEILASLSIIKIFSKFPSRHFEVFIYSLRTMMNTELIFVCGVMIKAHFSKIGIQLFHH